MARRRHRWERRSRPWLYDTLRLFSDARPIGNTAVSARTALRRTARQLPTLLVATTLILRPCSLDRYLG